MLITLRYWQGLLFSYVLYRGDDSNTCAKFGLKYGAGVSSNLVTTRGHVTGIRSHVTGNLSHVTGVLGHPVT